jgi:hypothetical protein
VGLPGSAQQPRQIRPHVVRGGEEQRHRDHAPYTLGGETVEHVGQPRHGQVEERGLDAQVGPALPDGRGELGDGARVTRVAAPVCHRDESRLSHPIPRARRAAAGSREGALRAIP